MTYEYKFIFTTGIKPDVTALNQEVAAGWEFIQMGQSSSPQLTGQWYYLLRKKATPATTPKR